MVDRPHPQLRRQRPNTTKGKGSIAGAIRKQDKRVMRDGTGHSLGKSPPKDSDLNSGEMFARRAPGTLVFY